MPELTVAPAELVDEFGRCHVRGDDLVMELPTAFGLGFEHTIPEWPFGPGERTYGHNGSGGSLALVDPDAGVSLWVRHEPPLVGPRPHRPAVGADLRLGVFAGVAIVVSAVEPALFHFGIDRTYYGTDTRAAEIAVGILLAVLLFPAVAGAEADRPLERRGRRWLIVVSTAALVAMAAAWASIPETSPLWRDGGFVLYALGRRRWWRPACSVGPVGRLGWLKPLVRLGVISYAVYLVHWPILWVIDVETDWPPLVRFVVALAASVAIAEVSLRVLEGPIRRTGRVAHVRRWRWSPRSPWWRCSGGCWSPGAHRLRSSTTPRLLTWSTRWRRPRRRRSREGAPRPRPS